MALLQKEVFPSSFPIASSHRERTCLSVLKLKQICFVLPVSSSVSRLDLFLVYISISWEHVCLKPKWIKIHIPFSENNWRRPQIRLPFPPMPNLLCRVRACHVGVCLRQKESFDCVLQTREESITLDTVL